MSEDDINAAVAHIVLCAVAGHGLGRYHSRNFSHPGLHANYFVHGVVGFLHYQAGKFNSDFKAVYEISYHASRYLPIPCLMADLYYSDNALSSLHLASGIIPFALAVSGKDNPHLGKLMILGNIISLCYYGVKQNREWAYYTAGAAALAYFVAPQSNKKVGYPLLLALVDYCAYRVYRVHFTL